MKRAIVAIPFGLFLSGCSVLGRTLIRVRRYYPEINFTPYILGVLGLLWVVGAFRMMLSERKERRLAEEEEEKSAAEYKKWRESIPASCEYLYQELHKASEKYILGKGVAGSPPVSQEENNQAWEEVDRARQALKDCIKKHAEGQ